MLQLLFENQPIDFTEKQVWHIGRKGFGADIELNDTAVSRSHASFKLDALSAKISVKDLGSSNGTFVDGKKIEPQVWVLLKSGNRVSISSFEFVLHDSDEQQTFKEKKNIKSPKSSLYAQLLERGKIHIGRATENQLLLNDPTVSRKHAVLSYENNCFWIEDLGSVNKTFVNGLEIRSKTEIKETDSITISFFRIHLQEGVTDLRETSASISAVGIQKKYPNGKIGLQTLTVDVEKSSFVALMGPSGCGKSTLLKCLNGDNPATSGEVLIHGLSLVKNFNLVKKKIGYVPQDDIIHRELSVYKTLYLAAKLRLPDDTTDTEIDNRINKVIKDLKLDQDANTDIRKVKVGSLSGGQRKRVSIAVELLTDPTILFLDEPTSPLDPETIESFLLSLRELSKRGTTIIMVTHKPEDLNYVDQVIFLGVQGHLVYKGDATKLTQHFDAKNIVEVYSQMSNIDKVKTKYRKPSDQIFEKNQTSDLKRDKPDSLVLQLFWLTNRYFKIKLNDRENLLLLLAQPIIIASLVCLVFKQFQLGVLFLVAISAIWFGVSNAAKEIVGELSVYKRERMFNLNLHTYIFSKWLVLSLIALIQTLIFTTIVYLNFKWQATTDFEDIYLRGFFPSWMFMFWVSASATLTGLFLSSWFSTTEKVMTVVPIALMPQIMLAGVMTKIDKLPIELVSFFTLGRWGTEGLARIQDSYHQAEEGESVKSLLTTLPINGEDTTMAVGAMDSLDLYNAKLIEEGKIIGDFFNSMDANLLAIAGLNILFYVLIVFSLKKKDSL
jgi:ABC-type multidrug transport system ATPase subunit/pSer/pThr/pTyr-binding forkhead associated (FHA) protein